MGQTEFSNGKPIRFVLGFFLGAIWILFGCQLAGRIVPSIAQASQAVSGPSPAPTSYPAPGYPYPGAGAQPSPLPPVTEAQAPSPTGGLYPYPGPGAQPSLPSPTGEISPTNPAGEGYPFPGAAIPSVTAGSRTPAATLARSASQTITVTPTSGNCDPAYPEICIPPPPPDLDCSDITQRDFVVLPPDPHGFDPDFDTIGCEADELGSPGEEYPYPGAFTQAPPPTPVPGEGYAYPVPGQPTPTATRPSGPVPFTPTGTLHSPWTSTPVTPPAFAPTQPAPALTEVLIPSSVPTATRIPFLSPTPTLTRTPTVTPTRRPLSPWVSSRLRASDPRTVKLASGKPQLIEFFAFWSGPSQAMAPIVHPLEQSYSDRMNFLFLDIDDPANKAFKTKLGFRFEPHFFLLDSQGNIMKQWVGYVRTQEFVDAFEEALKK